MSESSIEKSTRDLAQSSNEKILFLMNRFTGVAPYSHEFVIGDLDPQMLSGFVGAMGSFLGEFVGAERSQWKTVYGSDTELAEKLLLKAARANPMVLKTPESRAVFLGFGDNSLKFELRVFINGIDDWIPMLHKLNRTIDREFKKAGITISFPQRDVHLDATGPLEVKVVSDSPSSAPQSDSN